MKVNPEEAIKSVIAFKARQRKQSEHEDKIMFDLVKNRKEFDKKKEQWLIETNGIKKKDLEGMREVAQKVYKKSFEEFKKIKRPQKEPGSQPLKHFGGPPPPPAPPGGTFQAVCFQSSIFCTGDFCDSDNAKLFPVFESDSVGGYLGSWATVAPPDQTNSLFYWFVPNTDGPANIIAEVLLSGVISAHTEALYVLNFFFPSGARSTADVKFSLRMNVWQGNTLLATTDLVIADIHCQDGDSKFLAYTDDLFILTLSTVVTKDTAVVIELMTVANLTGRSHVGVAFVDFGKGHTFHDFDLGIRVPQLCVFVNP